MLINGNLFDKIHKQLKPKATNQIQYNCQYRSISQCIKRISSGSICLPILYIIDCNFKLQLFASIDFGLNHIRYVQYVYCIIATNNNMKNCPSTLNSQVVKLYLANGYMLSNLNEKQNIVIFHNIQETHYHLNQ